MMKLLGFILLLIAALGDRCDSTRLRTDYLELLPSGGSIQQALKWPLAGASAESALEWLRNEIETKGSIDPKVTLALMQKTLDDQRFSDGSNKELLDVLGKLIGMSNPTSGLLCCEEGIEFFATLTTKIYDNFIKFIRHSIIFNGDSEKDNNLTRFFRYYAAMNSKQCVASTAERFNSELKRVDSRYIKTFDKLVVEDSIVAMDDSSLASIAQEFDFVSAFSGRYKSRKFFEIIQPLVMGPPISSVDQFVSIMQLMCAEIRKPMGAVFDSFNLAMAMSPFEEIKVELPDSFHKINEYSRLCLQLQNKDPTLVLDSIRSGM